MLDEFSEEFTKDCVLFPAISDRLSDVYFIYEQKIVGIGSVGSAYHGEVVVYLKDAASQGFFKRDPYVQSVGEWAAFRFFKYTGLASVQYSDEPEDRLDGVSIVDKIEFDFGLASKKRYSDVNGYGGKLEAA